jgi:peptidoglycan/LPS O-acetylase OafA/YrhL
VLRHWPSFFRSVAGAGDRGPIEVVALLTYWANYAYVHLFAPAPDALGIFWSLCVEEHFYLVWPAALLVVRSRKGRIALVLLFLAGLPLARTAAAEVNRAAAYTLTHLRVDSILWGALAALAGPDRITPRARRLVLATLLVLGATRSHHGLLDVKFGPEAYALTFTGIAIFAAALVVEVSTSPETTLARTLALRPLRAVGRVSYGMYLLHFPALDLAFPGVVWMAPRAGPGAFLLLYVVTVATTWTLAALMYAAWEKPFLRIKDRFRPSVAPRAA